MDNYAVYKKEIQDDLETYKGILDGEIKKFPNGFWNKPYKYELSSIILRYLIDERLKLSREELIKVYGFKFIKENKLSGMYNKVFNRYMYKMIDNAYPGEFKEWEFESVYKGFWTDDNIRSAVKWFIEDVQKLDINKDRRKIKCVYTGNNLSKAGLGAIVVKGIYNTINMAYPNVFRLEDFKSNRVRSDRTGKVYNNLQIMKELGGDKVIAKCLLCNSEKEYNKGSVVRGDTKSCGCKSRRLVDKTGEIFNKLQITKELGGNKVRAKCLICNSEREYVKQRIIVGDTKNCGCVKEVKKGYKTSNIEVLDFMYKGRDKLRYYKCLNGTGEELILSREDIIKMK